MTESATLERADAPAPITTQPLTDALIVPLGLLAPSRTNPRKRFKAGSIEELATTIEPHGVMQPLLVRPHPDAAEGNGITPYEIVAGERRWRSCSLLVEQGRQYPNFGRVPVLVRQLADGEVLALQLVENIQREDLHPLEEAEHYWLMTNHPREAITVEELAHTIGKSANYVYARMSLRKLVQPAREAFEAGKLDLSKALKVAAMPPDQQPEIVEHITTWGGEPMGARATSRYIYDHYTLLLSGAPFNVNDPELLPAAGACTACPKRSDKHPQLFEAVNDGDRCMDAKCFGAKRQAVRDWKLANAKAEGYAVVEGNAATAVLVAKGTAMADGWHDLAARVPAHLGDAALTVEQVLERANVEAESISVVDHPQRPELVYAVTTTVLETALVLAGMHASQNQPKPSKTKACGTSGTHMFQDDVPPARNGSKAPAPVPSKPVATLESLLDFTVLPESAKTVKPDALEMFVKRARERAEGAIVVHKVCGELRDRGDEMRAMLPREVANLFAISLLTADIGHWPLTDIAKLAGVDADSLADEGVKDSEATTWLFGLSQIDATCMAYAMLALQADDGLLPLGGYRMLISSLMGVAWRPVLAAAEKMVNEKLQLELLARGTPVGGEGEAKGKGKKKPAPAAKKTPAAPASKVAVRYRDAASGMAWTGRGLQPKWIKVALENGKTLADFEVQAAPAAGAQGAGGKKGQKDKAAAPRSATKGDAR